MGIAIGVAGLALLGAAPGADAADGPLDTLRDVLTRAERVVNGEGTRREKLLSLGEVAGDLLDTEVMGVAALDGRLAEQPEPRQREFQRLFHDVVVRAYLQKLLLFRHPEFAYGGEEIEGDRARVRTRIVTPGDEYRVDYAMRRRAGRWRVTDIEVESVSLTGNYRAQFESLLRTRSFDELLETMSRKVRRRAERDAATAARGES